MRIALVPLLLLAGCATNATKEALASWVGAPERELLAAWGPPVKQAELGGKRQVVYEDRRKLHIAGSPGHVGTANGLPVVVPEVPAMDVEVVCTSTFTVAAGVVEASDAQGNGCDVEKYPRRR